MPKPLERIGAIYGRPFLKDLATSPERAMRLLKNELAYRIKKKLQDAQISERARKAFAKSIVVRLGPSSILIESKHPAMSKIIAGQKPGQMKWLMKAKTPIPIITDSGELIFRNATPRSMQNGKWVHPGRQPQTFVDLAKREAKELVKQRIVAEFQRIITTESKRK